MTSSDYELLDYHIRIFRKINPEVSMVRMIGIVIEFSFPTRNYHSSAYNYSKANENDNPKHKITDADLLKALINYNSRK